jgi:hypothetical protein
VAVSGHDHQFTTARHRIARVGREIGEAGLELRRINNDRPDVVDEIERNLDILAEQAAQQRDHAADQPIELDPLGLQGLAPRKGQ